MYAKRARLIHVRCNPRALLQTLQNPLQTEISNDSTNLLEGPFKKIKCVMELGS